MELGLGSQLGPYKILAALGAGGMGEVYRARDPRLNREVAVKILTLEDPERQKRFQREAQAASALNHPNILSVYDVGNENGTLYIVSELVEGEPLRKLIQRGPVPAKKLLEIAVQIADGLAAAHQAGIVHRDLKPENIMIGRDGRVKILDFGLAKAMLPKSGTAEEETESALTESGVVLGTIRYMSPEQASGGAIDFRSDQFSFGSILYEMATGKQPFVRNTPVQTLSAIVSEEAALLISIPLLPAPLRWLIERCLAKEPKQRYDSTADLFRDLRTLRDHLSEETFSGLQRVGKVAPSSRHAKVFALVAGLLIALMLATIFVVKRSGFVAARESVIQTFPVYHRLTFRRGTVYSARFAPDGHTIVYSAAWDGNPPEIYAGIPGSADYRSLGLSNASILSISRSGEMALLLDCRYVSPDTGLVGTLAWVPLSGGAPREVMENVVSADWAADGSELAVLRLVGNSSRIEFPLGKVLYQTSSLVQDLRVSPKGEQLAFLEYAPKASVVVIDRSGRKQTLSENWDYFENLAWSPFSDEIWFAASRREPYVKELHAVTLSGEERLLLRVTDEVRLQEISQDRRVLMIVNNERAQMNALAPGETQERDVSWFDWSWVRDISSDGKTILFDEIGGTGETRDITYIRKTDGSPAIRLGEGNPWDISPDGKWVAGTGSQNTDSESKQLILIPTGVGQSAVLPPGPIVQYEGAAWLPDGKRILFRGKEKDHGFRIYLQDIGGSKPRAISPEGVDFIFPNSISPNGKLVVITRDGRFWLHPIDGGEAHPIPALDPKQDYVLGWNADGGALYVRLGAGGNSQKIYLVDVSTGVKKLWKELKPLDGAGVSFIFNPRITPDGKSYAYSYERTLSELYLVDGLK